jgi:hypothetical protein
MVPAFLQCWLRAFKFSPGQHHGHGAGASAIRRQPAGGTRGRDDRRGGLHRQAGQRPGAEQEGLGDEVQEYAVLAGFNEPKKSCHGVRKARAEVAAYAECTESQMMPMFGWTDPKMPALYIAQANREKLGISGMDKVVAFDRSQSLDDFLAMPDENNAGTCTENRVVTFRSSIWKKRSRFSCLRVGVVRSEGGEDDSDCNNLAPGWNDMALFMP